MILWWKKWPTLEAVMTFHWFSGTLEPYLLHIPCGFQNQLQSLKKLWKHTKQYKITIFEAHLLLCNKMWIYQRMNWSSLLSNHHPKYFPLVSLLRWEILDNFIKRYKHSVTFQLYTNHVIKGVSKRCWLEWSINMPSCATQCCKKIFYRLKV